MVAPYESMELLSLEVTFAQNLSPLFRGRAAPMRRLHHFENTDVVEHRLGRPGSQQQQSKSRGHWRTWRNFGGVWRNLEEFGTFADGAILRPSVFARQEFLVGRNVIISCHKTRWFGLRCPPLSHTVASARWTALLITKQNRFQRFALLVVP